LRPPDKGLIPWLPFGYNRIKLQKPWVRTAILAFSLVLLWRGLALGIDIATDMMNAAQIKTLASVEERVFTYLRLWSPRRAANFEETFVFDGQQPPSLNAANWTWSGAGTPEFGKAEDINSNNRPLTLKSRTVVTKSSGVFYDFTASFPVRIETGDRATCTIRTSGGNDGYLFELVSARDELRLTLWSLGSNPSRKLDERRHPLPGCCDRTVTFFVELTAKDYTFEGSIRPEGQKGDFEPLNYRFQDEKCAILSPFCKRGGQLAFVANADSEFALYSMRINTNVKGTITP